MRLSKQLPAPWTLIGAQMVALHGCLRGRTPIRPSKDADILVDVRMVSQGIAAVSQALVRDGYELSERSVGGHGHSFGRGEVSFDVLAPDGLGSRAHLATVHDFRTVTVPGGTQALLRTAPVEVHHGRSREQFHFLTFSERSWSNLERSSLMTSRTLSALTWHSYFRLSKIPTSWPSNAHHRSGDGFANTPTSVILTTPAGPGSSRLKTELPSTAASPQTLPDPMDPTPPPPTRPVQAVGPAAGFAGPGPARPR